VDQLTQSTRDSMLKAILSMSKEGVKAEPLQANGVSSAIEI
jgi:hypothetical protein